MPHDTAIWSEQYRQQREKEQVAKHKRQRVQRRGLGFIGWTWACFIDAWTRGQAVHCEHCGIECAPEFGVCDECSIRQAREQDERELRAQREQRASDQQDYAAYMRR